MKLILFTALALGLAPQIASAVPVMNENVSASRTVTIFPDHANPFVFYIAPNQLGVCMDGNNVPQFSYQDVRVRGSVQGLIQMAFCARYTNTDLDAAQAGISARMPGARFAPLPFIASKMIFNKALSPFVAEEFCTHTAGMVGDAQTCSFRLNLTGRAVFLRQVRRNIAMSHQYEYSVEGFLRMPDGSFTPTRTTYGLIAMIGGKELADHPELFTDQYGHVKRR